MAIRNSILFLVGLVLVLAAQAGVDEPRKPAVPASPFFPGYSGLTSKSIQKEIGLTEEQIQKITEISKEFQATERKVYPRVDWAKLSEEERKKKQAEMSKLYEKWTDEYKKRLGEARQQIEAVLTPEQLNKWESIEVRQYGAPMLLSGGLNEKLKLTDEQKEQLRKQNDQLQKKLAELYQQQQTLRNQAHRDALEILTPEQVNELKKIKKEGYFRRGTGGFPQPRK
jgi:Spy/CpxP family protein refolding chaperone